MLGVLRELTVLRSSTPGPHGHVALRDALTPRCAADQLPGCAAVARGTQHRNPVRRVDRQPHTASSRGAMCQETAAPELPLDDQTPTRTRQQSVQRAPSG